MLQSRGSQRVGHGSFEFRMTLLQGGEKVDLGAEKPKLQFEDSIFPMYVIVSKMLESMTFSFVIWKMRTSQILWDI